MVAKGLRAKGRRTSELGTQTVLYKSRSFSLVAKARYLKTNCTLQLPHVAYWRRSTMTRILAPIAHLVASAYAAAPNLVESGSNSLGLAVSPNCRQAVCPLNCIRLLQ